MRIWINIGTSNQDQDFATSDPDPAYRNRDEIELLFSLLMTYLTFWNERSDPDGSVKRIKVCTFIERLLGFLTFDGEAEAGGGLSEWAGHWLGEADRTLGAVLRQPPPYGFHLHRVTGIVTYCMKCNNRKQLRIDAPWQKYGPKQGG